VRLRGYVAAAAAVSLLSLAGCAESEEPAKDPSPGEPTTQATEPDATEPTGGADESAVPSGGSVDDPAVVTADEDLLDWQPPADALGATPDDSVVVGEQAAVAVPQTADRATVTGADGFSEVVSAPSDRQITDSFVVGSTVVLVLLDKNEERPTIAWAVDTTSGDRSELDDDAKVVPASGGTWTVGADNRLYYPTYEARRYCLASAPLDFGSQRVEWCAEPQHGYRGTKVTPEGASVLSFDDARPVSCRTEVVIADGTATEFTGVEECTAWDGLLVPGGAAWMTLPNEKNQEVGAVYARSGDQYFDLGPALAGSLTWCGDATYFVRDPQRDNDPAELLRWSADGRLSVVYQSLGNGQALLTQPQCADGRLTVTSLSEAGDEVVTAPTS
jgi:hypothetical protein